MKRYFFFTYGTFCHLLFLGTYLYMAGFVGNILVPKSIDSVGEGSVAIAVLINSLLIAAFGISHSVMARPWFKRWWTQYVPEAIERSTYVLVSCIMLGFLMWQWRPIGLVIWDVQTPVLRLAIHGLFAIGWLMVPAVSMLINHFDLFGSRQVWLHLKGKNYEELPFRTPVIYSRVRHPLYVGWMIAFWATPTMTIAHLVFAGLMTAYMLIAIPFEERDLIMLHGESYKHYRKQVPALIPRLGKTPTKEASDLIDQTTTTATTTATTTTSAATIPTPGHATVASMQMEDAR